MATYEELYDLRNDSTLRNRVLVAIVVKAQEIIDSVTPTSAEVTWAEEALENPGMHLDGLLHYVLSANKDASVAQILGATDTAIQTNIDSAVDVFIAGGA